MRVQHGGVAAHCNAGKTLDLHFSPRGGQRFQRGMADDFAVIAIGHDHAATLRLEPLRFQRGAVQPRRHTPIEPVAHIEIIGPLAIAKQVPASDLDLDYGHQPLGIDPHQVGTARVFQRNFAQAPNAITREQPHDPPRDAVRTIGSDHFSTGWRIGRRGESIGHGHKMEQTANAVNRTVRTVRSIGGFQQCRYRILGAKEFVPEGMGCRIASATTIGNGIKGCNAGGQNRVEVVNRLCNEVDPPLRHRIESGAKIDRVHREPIVGLPCVARRF